VRINQIFNRSLIETITTMDRTTMLKITTVHRVEVAAVVKVVERLRIRLGAGMLRVIMVQ